MTMTMHILVFDFLHLCQIKLEKRSFLHKRLFASVEVTRLTVLSIIKTECEKDARLMQIDFLMFLTIVLDFFFTRKSFLYGLGKHPF